jgi:hypothetical protein
MHRKHDEDWTLGRCPRCGHVAPVKVAPGQEANPFQVNEDDDGLAELKECNSCGLGGAPRSSVKGGYFRRDLLEVVDGLPEMGKPCYHCGVRVPKFLDLESEDHCRIYQLSRTDEEAAIDALCEATGCPREWARIWVTHPFGPRRPARLWVGPPCPQCSRPLRTRLARQCFECGLDWHGQDKLSATG